MASETGSPISPLIAEELEQLLSSETFRASRQSGRLLRYLVENTLGGRDDLLRERAIGTHLFGREPRYDTNEDSIVRVNVNDLRKRLARYYHESNRSFPVQFSIPVGSYKVEFQQAAELPAGGPEPAPASASPRTRRRGLLVAVLAVALTVSVFMISFLRSKPETVIDQFWAPALKGSDAPIIVLAPHPVVYNFSREVYQRFSQTGTTHAQRNIDALSGPPDATIRWREVVPIRDQYIGQGSAHAIAALSAWLASVHRRIDVRFGAESSFADIRNAPAVLIGAYANKWTLQLTGELRFVLSDDNGVPEILDRNTGRKWSLPQLALDGSTNEDYVIISRVFHPKTGKLLVALAGITQYGNRTAGEFVTEPVLLGEAMRNAPPGWYSKNLQIVLHVPVVERVPGKPEVLAVHSW